MKRTNVFVTVFVVQLALSIAASSGWADLVGKPAQEITVGDWLNSDPLTLKDLRGKIVVLEFWATWCPPCRDSIPHLNKLHEEYKDKGVVIIGITQESKGKVKPFAKRMDMKYVVGISGGNTSRAYGVRGIPHAFIIDTEGIVRWSGHPMGGLDEAIEKQLKDTPPRLLSPKKVKMIRKLISEAEVLLVQESYPEAASKAQRVKDIKNVDIKLLDGANEILEKIAKKAEKELAEAEEFTAAKDYASADKVLVRIRRTHKGMPAATKAAQLLKDMHSNPEIAEMINSAKKEEKASRTLNLAEQARVTGRYAEALKQYDRLLKKYPGTESEETAAEKAAAIRSDPEIMAIVRDQLAEKECNRMLDTAESYIANQKFDRARVYLQEIIDDYPDTSFARKAKEKLEKLGEKIR